MAHSVCKMTVEDTFNLIQNLNGVSVINCLLAKEPGNIRVAPLWIINIS